MTPPHDDQPVTTAGPRLAEADAVVILVHGRGATAESILSLADEIALSNVAYLAPQAANRTWYPNSFLAPVETNEPGRTSGLEQIGTLLEEAAGAGINPEQAALVGFSQGACLASEYVARRPRRFGGLAALSGGLIGASIDPNSYEGDLEGTPVFLGCSDRDPHIPAERVEETAAIFERLNAEVDTRLYPGMGHGINADELEQVTQLVAALIE